jgi:hypothetical protein
MDPKQKIALQWQEHIYEVAIRQPYPGQWENTETKAKFAASLTDEPKPIRFYLCESVVEFAAPEMIHLYLEKFFQRIFSLGESTNKNNVSYFKIHESDDYGATVILINNEEARIQLERSL